MPNTKTQALGRVWPQLRTKGLAIIQAADRAAEQGAEETAAAMRYLAPVDERELISSIRVEEPENDRFIGRLVKAGDETTIVTNGRGIRFQNAKLQEEGTFNMPANPFFNPAWRMLRQRVRSRITREIRKAWSR